MNKVEKTKLLRRIFLWIFRKQIADIIHNHTESIKVRHVIAINQSANRVYIEVLEFIIKDIDDYFAPYSNISAKSTMKEMKDFCGLKLTTLKKLLNEYNKLEDNDEKKRKDKKEIHKHD